MFIVKIEAPAPGTFTKAVSEVIRKSLLGLDLVAYTDERYSINNRVEILVDLAPGFDSNENEIKAMDLIKSTLPTATVKR